MAKRWEIWFLLVSLALVSATAKLRQQTPEPAATPTPVITPIIERVEPRPAVSVNKGAQEWLNIARAEREQGYGFGAAYKKAYKLDPTLHEAFDGWMLSLVQNGVEHKIAAKMIEAQLEKGQSCAHCHYNLGWAYGRLSRYEDSSEHERLAFELDPSDPIIAQTHAGNVKHEEALRVYRIALRHNPENISLRYNLVYEHSQEKEWVQALSELKVIEDLGLDTPNNTIQARAQILIEAERLKEAITEFTRAIKVSQDEREIFDVLLRRGGLYRDLQQYERALADYKRAESLELPTQDSRLELASEIAVTLDHSQGEEAALDYLTKLCDEKPNSAMRLNLRGSFLEKFGRNKEAKTDYLRAAGLLDTGRDVVLYSGFVSEQLKAHAAEL